MGKLICLFVVGLLAGACSPSESPPEVSQQAVVKPAAEDQQARLQRLWVRSCALCHVDGKSGAPKIGNHADWGERLAKGRDVLVDNTIAGLNDMPPLGYCMACERADFEALVDFMTGGINPVTGGGP